MGWFLGIDTSNYTTSVAAYNPEREVLIQSKKKLQVKRGEVGLRQNDAVFAHVKNIASLIEDVTRQISSIISVGVSVRPRDIEGSYMPCFLTGKAVADSVAAVLGIPANYYSHQAGHIAAALYDTGNLELAKSSFIAFHLSGGTTESMYVKAGKDHAFDISIISSSLDLYAGQAVDRIGNMLGLEFPAGPQMEELANQSRKVYTPKPFFRDGCPSISGLENQCKNMLSSGEEPANIAKYSFDWLGGMLAVMTKDAKRNYPDIPVIYSGGVMSNKIISKRITSEFGGFFASPEYSADNAAGVAVLSALSTKENDK